MNVELRALLDNPCVLRIFMIDHITVFVTDLTKSRAFYEKAFTPFAFSLSFGQEKKFWAFDVGDGALFEIAQYTGKDKLTHCHIAFRANSQEQVREFYEVALTAGGRCNGKPGPRPQYTKNYYAAFIIDPDGHNIEAVFDKVN